MISSEIKIRVRYSETDQMGYVYYGNYAQYFEVARTEMLRNNGLTYKEMEERGLMLPVSLFDIKYIKPGFYDDLLSIKIYLKKIPSVRMVFNYETYNQKKELLNIANTTLVFIDKENKKPTKAPDFFISKISKYF